VMKPKRINPRAEASNLCAKRGRDAKLTFEELHAIKRDGQAFQRGNPPKTVKDAEGRLYIKSATVRKAKVRWPKP